MNVIKIFMRLKYFNILFVLLLFSFCKKPIPPSSSLPLPSDDNNNPVVIWEYELVDGTSWVSSINPVLFEDLIVTSIKAFNGENEKLLALKKEEGELIWEWDNYIKPAPQSIGPVEAVALIDDALLISSGPDNYGIKINSGTTIWATNQEGGQRTIITYNTSVFHSISYGNSPHSDSSSLMMCDYLEGNWQEIFKVITPVYNMKIYPPSAYKNQNNETLLVFQTRGGSFNPGFVDRVDLYCYNLTQDSIVWYKPDFTPSGSSNVRAPIVEGDLVYFGGKWDFYCIDILSGEVIWTHNFYWDYQNSNFLIYNDLIITNLDNGDLIAIDKNSGEQVWVNEDLSGCCTELRIFEDRIYFANDDLHIVNANTGEQLYEFESPHNGGRFSTGIAVDLENKKMYASDGHFFMCMELPE
jgi:outer membrane protein assembly factor BamB